ncbi:MAG: hypothetical protein A4E49_00383 [Methanosaeta sp. PtaU1.Bin112]|nr:MAG: hypothetical protein A4E49_00383 [Methanosaeta sp. PtaU1.Bin112]
MKTLKIGPWIKNIILLIDLGFYKHQLFSRIVENGGSFVSCLKSNSNPLIVGVNQVRNCRGIDPKGKYLKDIKLEKSDDILRSLQRISLKKWYYWATHSQLDPIIDAAKTIKSLWDGIINYAETKISNGVLEGINSMVQSAKSSARVFRTTKNIILIIYFRLGKLQFNLPT